MTTCDSQSISIVSLLNLSILIALTEAALVDPTSTSGDTENYINSEYNTTTGNTDYFKGDTINCSKTICNIECDAYRGCHNTKINAGNTTTSINLECTGPEACRIMDLYVDNVTAINIQCSNKRACYSQEIYANNTENIDIKCNFNASSTSYGSCYSQKLYAANSGNTNLYCNSNNCYNINYDLDHALSASIYGEGYRSMYSADFYADHMRNRLNITCKDNDACRNAVFRTTEMTSNLYISCYGENACYNAEVRGGTMTGDVLITFEGDARNTSFNKDFEINTAGISGSLTLDCISSYSCGYVRVYCPETSCNINCMDDYSCYYSDFYIQNPFNASYLNLNCHNSSTSCLYADLRCIEKAAGITQLSYDIVSGNWECGNYGCCPFGRRNRICPAGQLCEIDCGKESCRGYSIDASEATTLRLNCTGEYACDGIKVQCPTLSIADSCIIECPGNYSCQYSYVIAGDMNTTKLDVQCTGFRGCSQMYIEANASIIETVSINCTAPYSCYDMDIFAKANKVILDCSGSQSCQYLRTIGIAEDLSVDCTAYHCCYRVDVFYTIGNDNFLLNCLSQRSCNEIYANLTSTKPNTNIGISCMNNAGPATWYDSACLDAFYKIYGYIGNNGNNTKSNNISMQCNQYGCYSVGLYVYNSYYVHVDCSHQYSCKSMALNADSSTYLNLYCGDTYSCSNAGIDCPHKDIDGCVIDCSSNGQSCDSLSITVPDSYIYDYLDLQCEAILPNGTIVESANSCSGLEIICSGNREKIQWIYNATTDNYNCSHSNSSYCCPYYEGPKKQCIANQQCIIDCQNTDCSEQVIDGVQAAFLTVYCGETNCINSYIYCPDKGCIVECSAYYSCYKADIIYNGAISDKGSVSVKCYGGRGACSYTKINAEYADHLKVNCTVGDDENIVCYATEVNAQYANIVNVDLYEYGATHRVYWNLNYSNSVYFNARGYAASYYSYFMAENAQSVEINCISNVGYGYITWDRDWKQREAGCKYTEWYIPSNTIFNCYGTGCSHLYELYPTEGSVSDLNFNIYSCGQCGDAADCLNKFRLFCGTDFNYHQDFDYAVCSEDDYDCGCYTLINNALFFTSKNIDKCYEPIKTSTCDANENCIIACDSAKDCSNTILNASEASGLTIDCVYDCEYSLFLCPVQGCNITCHTSSACLNTKVFYGGNYNDKGKVYVKCIARYSCENIKVYARNAYWVNIVASEYAYYDAQLSVNNVNQLIINATGERAFAYSGLFAEYSTNMVLNCESNENENGGACYLNSMYLPNDPVIVCYGWGCYDLGTLNFDSVDNTPLWVLDGCQHCRTPFDCIYDFNLRCGRREALSLSYSSYFYSNTFYYTTGPKNSNNGNRGNCSMPVAAEDCGCYEILNNKIQFSNDTYYCTLNSTDNSYESYTYLFDDILYSLYDWQSNGNVVIESSSNCPSTPNDTILFEANTICVINSSNKAWDGQYKFKYYSENVDGIIYVYRNNEMSTDIYQYIEENTQRFYINNYQDNVRFMTKCVAENIMDIRDCIGKWQHNHNNTWTMDANMISITCNDLCVNAGVDLEVTAGSQFKWQGFSDEYRTNYYYSEQDGMLLTGYVEGKQFGNSKAYVWTMVADSDQSDASYVCLVAPIGTEYSEDYVFDIEDCMGSDKWAKLSVGSVDISLSDCSANNANNEQNSIQENEICIEKSHEALLDGIYSWLYFDETTNSAIYYGSKPTAYIELDLNTTGNYQYLIYRNQAMGSSTLQAKCNVINESFDITECLGKWEIYYDKAWNKDTDMIAVQCQSICFNGNWGIDASELRNLYISDGIFVYQHFDTTQKSNVYYSKELDVYLYGWSQWHDNGNHMSWFIGYDYNSNDRDNLQAACNLTGIFTNDYILNIDDCSSSSLWKVKLGSVWESEGYYTTKPYKCHPRTVTTCAKLQSDSEIYRSISLDAEYRDLAVGFDLNMALLSVSDVFTVQYSCAESDNIYEELTTFRYDIADINVQNIVYNLPQTKCDNSSLISLKFMLNGTNSVYMNNVYLYYNVENEIYYDDMDTASNWTENSETAIAGYDSPAECEADGKCYLLFVSSPDTDNDVSISKTIITSAIGYMYKDYKLEWSLKTNGLKDNALFDVKVQCSDNYLYVHDLCILKEYNAKSDCTNNSCNVEAYQLPSECDLSREITIQFYLKSSSVTDRVYIDYVSLKHSETSGNIAPLCRTSSPTELPTFSPTPLSISTVITPFQWKWEYILAIVLGALLVLAIAIIATYLCVKRYAVNQYKMEMTVRNAMVILISIGEYDENAVNPDPELENVYMHDLAVERDITNLHLLFGPENLNYEIYPTYNLKYPRVHWTQKQIIDLLQQKAKQFYQERDKFDALVVAVSCHGMNKNIITSDFKLIEKVAIHRLFSTQYPESRELPRVFLFDCCDGNNERTIADSDSDDNEADNKTEAGKQMKERKMTPKVQTIADEMKDEEKTTEQGKNFGVDNIEGHSDNWNVGDRNPDHRLVEINAANPGFQSKLDSNIGSYMLYEFVKKTLDDLGDDMEKGEKCLYEIFAEIQQELADRGKQQIITTYNNRTRYIKFQKNIAVDSTSDDQQNETNTPIIEMQHVKTGDNGSENVGLETKVDEQEHLISS